MTRSRSHSSVISTSRAVPLSAVIDAATIRTRHALQIADYSKQEFARVSTALEALREDMGESGEGGAGPACH